MPFRYGAAFIAGSAFDAIVDPGLAAAALERIRAHLVAPATLIVACHVPSTSLQRLAAPLVEVRTVELDDGSQIALRSEAVWTRRRALDARAAALFAPAGQQRLAEENETVRGTWYAPADILDLARAAGLRDARDGAAAGERADERRAIALSRDGSRREQRSRELRALPAARRCRRRPSFRRRPRSCRDEPLDDDQLDPPLPPELIAKPPMLAGPWSSNPSPPSVPRLPATMSFATGNPTR